MLIHLLEHQIALSDANSPMDLSWIFLLLNSLTLDFELGSNQVTHLLAYVFCDQCGSKATFTKYTMPHNEFFCLGILAQRDCWLVLGISMPWQS